MTKPRKLIAVAVAALVLAAGVVLAAPGAAEAQVTNCTASGNLTQLSIYCAGTTATPPYTTQFRAKIRCRKSIDETYTVYSPWRTAGAGVWSTGYCTVAGYTVHSHIKEFR